MRDSLGGRTLRTSLFRYHDTTSSWPSLFSSFRRLYHLPDCWRAVRCYLAPSLDRNSRHNCCSGTIWRDRDRGWARASQRRRCGPACCVTYRSSRSQLSSCANRYLLHRRKPSQLDGADPRSRLAHVAVDLLLAFSSCRASFPGRIGYACGRLSSAWSCRGCGGRSEREEPVLMAAAAPRSLCAIR